MRPTYGGSWYYTPTRRRSTCDLRLGESKRHSTIGFRPVGHGAKISYGTVAGLAFLLVSGFHHIATRCKRSSEVCFVGMRVVGRVR